MATLSLEFPSKTLSADVATYSYRVLYTPPSIVSGKVCRLAVNQFLVSHDNIATYQIFKLEATFSQPFGGKVKWDDTENNTTQPNSVLCSTFSNSTFHPNTRTTLVHLEDGPMDITFTISCMGGITKTANITATKVLPDVFIQLSFTPETKNSNFEKLESYSTGPFIRM